MTSLSTTPRAIQARVSPLFREHRRWAVLLLAGLVFVIMTPVEPVAALQQPPPPAIIPRGRPEQPLSHYVQTREDAPHKFRRWGCELAQTRPAADFAKPFMTILDFGAPEATGVHLAGRTDPELSGYATFADIRGWVEVFILGYETCAGPIAITGELELVIGISNSGSLPAGAMSAHAGQWRTLVDELTTFMRELRNGPFPYGIEHSVKPVRIRGGIDLETSFEGVPPLLTFGARGDAWVQAYKSDRSYVNFGDCGNCGTNGTLITPTPSVCTQPIPPNQAGDLFGWPWQRVFDTHIGYPEALTVPEIYGDNCYQAYQWHWLMGATWNDQTPEVLGKNFYGIISQKAACEYLRASPLPIDRQNGAECNGQMNSMDAGRQRLRAVLDADPRTRGATIGPAQTNITQNQDSEYLTPGTVPYAALMTRALTIKANFVRVGFVNQEPRAQVLQIVWGDGADDGHLHQEPATADHWDVYSLQLGHTYHFQIRACDDTGACSELSEPLVVTTVDLPDTPSNVRIDSAGSSATNNLLRWQFGHPGFTYELRDITYQVAWQAYGSSTVSFVDFPDYSVEWNHTGLGAGQTYYYWVRACDPLGRCTPWSDPATGATSGGAAPAAPTNFRLGAVTTTSVQTLWDDVSSETRYELVWNRYGTPGYVVQNLDANTVTWTHPNLEPGWTYYYWLRACTGGVLCSSFVGVTIATTAGGIAPAMPSNLRLGNVNSEQIELLWQDNAATEDEYWIAWTSTVVIPGVPIVYHIEKRAANLTRWVHTNLPPNSGQYYWVAACRGGLCSGWEGVVQGTTTGGGDAPLRALRPNARAGPVVTAAVVSVPPPPVAVAHALTAPPPPTAARLLKPAVPVNAPPPGPSPTPTPTVTATATATPNPTPPASPTVSGTPTATGMPTATGTPLGGPPSPGPGRAPAPGTETPTPTITAPAGRGTPPPTKTPAAVPTSIRGGV